MCGSSRRSPRSTSHRRGLLRDLLTSSQAGPQRLPLLPVHPLPPPITPHFLSFGRDISTSSGFPGCDRRTLGVTALPDGGAQTSCCGERVVDTLCSLLRPLSRVKSGPHVLSPVTERGWPLPQVITHRPSPALSGVRTPCPAPACCPLSQRHPRLAASTLPFWPVCPHGHFPLKYLECLVPSWCLHLEKHVCDIKRRRKII